MVTRPVIAATCAALVTVSLALPAQAHSNSAQVSWRITPTGSSDQFRGLAAVSAQVAWVSGEKGTVLRTTDGGATWADVSPPAAAGLALRDIEAFNDKHAVTLSIGPGKQSGIFVTHNGGRTWKRTFTNHNCNAFYDCMAFSSDGTGLALSDPVNGHFRLAATHNHGQTWKLLVPQHIPDALDGEFAFAASGTCLVSGPGHEYWAVSGGVEHPRVFHTSDGGLNWTVADTPLRGGPSAGIYSVAFRGDSDGVAVGGDYADPDNRAAAAGVSDDGGQTWRLSSRQVFGYRSGVAYVTDRVVVAVGPTGSDVSRNGGLSWSHFDDDWYDGVECATDGTCWASGTSGRVAVLQR
jgi:photosystem II stability/assembly factor-like uncharacterized protein